PVAQEEENHDDGEDRPFDHCRHGAFVLLLSVLDGIEQRDEADAGVFGLDLRDFLLCRIEHGDVRSALGARHGEVDHFLVAHLADRGALAETVTNGCDIRQLYGSAVAELYLPLRQLIGRFGTAEHADRLARAAHFGVAPRRVDVGLSEHIVDLTGRYAESLHPLGVDNHLDLAVDAREAIDFGHPLDREQALGHRIVDKPAQLLDRHVVGFDREDTEETPGDVYLGHLWLDDPVG